MLLQGAKFETTVEIRSPGHSARTTSGFALSAQNSMPDQVFSGVGWSAALRSLPGSLLRDARSRGLRPRRFWIRRVLRIVRPFAAAALRIAIATASRVMVRHLPPFIGALTLNNKQSPPAGERLKP